MNIYLHNCSHNLMIPMHRKVNDDIFARFLVIMKNVLISFIKECRGPTLRPPCDVIDDVIIIKILFFGIIWDDFFISEVKLKLCLIFKIFQNDRHFELATNFFTGSYTGSWIYQKDSHEHFRHFDRCCSSNIDGDISISKFDLLCDLVMSSMTSWVCKT